MSVVVILMFCSGLIIDRTSNEISYFIVYCQLKCGACGGVGHMKTNKMCPKYTEMGSFHVAMTDDELNSEELSNMSQDNLIKVEGTKITLGKALLEA